MSLQSKLQEDLNASRKRRDPAATLVLGTTLSEVKNREIELKRDLTDDDVVEVFRRAIKKRREAVELYDKAGRPELAKKERDEITILETYLPAQANPDDIRAAVKTAIAGGAANVGAVMAKVMPQFKGKAEGSVINAIVREELGGK
jgi:uncharacterized protein YqeY